MPDPLKRASLRTLLCIVQCGGTYLTPSGRMPSSRRIVDRYKPPNEWYNHDQAEAEIERRFARLNSRIRKLLRERNDL